MYLRKSERRYRRHMVDLEILFYFPRDITQKKIDSRNWKKEKNKKCLEKTFNEFLVMSYEASG